MTKRDSHRRKCFVLEMWAQNNIVQRVWTFFMTCTMVYSPLHCCLIVSLMVLWCQLIRTRCSVVNECRKLSVRSRWPRLQTYACRLSSNCDCIYIYGNSCRDVKVLLCGMVENWRECTAGGNDKRRGDAIRESADRHNPDVHWPVHIFCDSMTAHVALRLLAACQCHVYDW